MVGEYWYAEILEGFANTAS